MDRYHSVCLKKILLVLIVFSLSDDSLTKSSIGTGYDPSTSQFSPDSGVFQLEYTSKVAVNSGTVVGIRGKDGVVFVIEKIVTSKLQDVLLTLSHTLE